MIGRSEYLVDKWVSFLLWLESEAHDSEAHNRNKGSSAIPKYALEDVQQKYQEV